jgi:hypothetical protein
MYKFIPLWISTNLPKFTYEFPPVVLILAVCNHIAQETGPCDHQEYGTQHTAIYIHTGGSNKSLLKFSKVLHP